MKSRRRGLRIICRQAHPEVGRAMKRFGRWLRLHYDFSIRVPVYLFAQDQLCTRAGKWVSATFFAPYKLSVEPHIKIAVGDYPALKRSHGKNMALAFMLCSLAHEVIHYRQWLKRQALTERGVVKKAQRMVECYSLEVSRFD